jgi:hypothetical protein
MTRGTTPSVLGGLADSPLTLVMRHHASRSTVTFSAKATGSVDGSKAYTSLRWTSEPRILVTSESSRPGVSAHRCPALSLGLDGCAVWALAFPGCRRGAGDGAADGAKQPAR